MSHIFISYSRQDQDYVTQLAQVLESHRLPVGLDDRINYGNEWPREIQRHLDACLAFVLVMSPRSRESTWVNNELARAIRLKKPIFPLWLEGDLWFEVEAYQAVDVRRKNIPPVRFFNDLRPYFPTPAATADSITLQDVVAKDFEPYEQEEAKQKEKDRKTEVERQYQAAKLYKSGQYNLSQGNYTQANADFSQAEKMGHPRAAQKLAEIQSLKLRSEAEGQLQSIMKKLRELINPNSSFGSKDDLSSEKGIDYSRLRDLLKAQDWRAADKETYEVMIRAVGKKSGQWFTSDELLNFPCTDLRTIDRLWVKYSQGKFGFSVQKKIYVECGAKLNGEYPGDTIWYKFCDHVGWRKGGKYLNYPDLKANPSLSLSPPGEIPRLGLWVWVGVVEGVESFVVSSLAQRLVTCSR